VASGRARTDARGAVWVHLHFTSAAKRRYRHSRHVTLMISGSGLPTTKVTLVH
jgi:hypothetical protein